MLRNHKSILFCVIQIFNVFPKTGVGRTDLPTKLSKRLTILMKIKKIVDLQCSNDFSNLNHFQVCSLEVSGGRLFSGSNRVVKVFDVASKEFLQDLKVFKSWVRSMKAAGNHLFWYEKNYYLDHVCLKE